MAISDYAHWNEEAPMIWWEEEGKHAPEPPEESFWEHEMREDYDEDYECQDAPDECMKNGNYDQMEGEIWRCSDCGHRFRIVDEPYLVTPLDG